MNLFLHYANFITDILYITQIPLFNEYIYYLMVLFLCGSFIYTIGYGIHTFFRRPQYQYLGAALTFGVGEIYMYYES